MASAAKAQPPASIRWPTIGQLWTFLGVALPALAALLVPMPAVDLAYQLRAGAGILAGGGIPAVDTWTFTIAGHPWLDQQWGAQVLLAGVFQVGGWTGLALLRAVLVGATFWLVQATLRSMGCAQRPAALLALGSFAVAAPALALRPQLFAIVLFAASMAILADRARHPRRLWLLPLIAAAWANLHGSFPLIVVLIGLGWLDEVTRVLAAPPPPKGVGPPRRTRTAEALRGSTGIALIGAVSAIATVVTPFGIDGWRYVANLASNPLIGSAVSEWRPPSPLDPAGVVFYLSLVIAALVAATRIRADGNRVGVATLTPVATLLAFGALGVFTGRGLAWWALVLPVSAATLAHDGSLTRVLPKMLAPLTALFTGPRPVPAPARLERGSPLNAIVAIALVAVGLILLPAWRPLGAAGVPLGTLSYAPQGIARELRRLAEGAGQLAPAVWNPQAWGSWLEWSAPQLRYAVDSRIELFPSELWRDSRQFANGDGEWLSILDEYAVDVVVLTPEEFDLEPVLDASPDWDLAYRDPEGSIWRR